VPRRVERDVLADDPVRADLAERHALRPREEPADERFGDAMARAPRLQAMLTRQDGDADLRPLGIVAGDVDRRAGAPGQEQTPAA
jgi:hypothetical protein